MVDSQSSELMKSAFRVNVGGVCFFGSSKHTEILVLAVVLDLRHPSAVSFVLCRAEQSTGEIMAWGFAYILVVLALRCFSQIVPSVVRSNTVDMVYLFLRPSACHVIKGETVREIAATVYADVDIAVVPNAAGNIANLDALARSRKLDKLSNLITKQFAQTCRRKIGKSHDCGSFAVVVRGLRVLIAQAGLAILPCATWGNV